jgi:hypothetical protein
MYRRAWLILFALWWLVKLGAFSFHASRLDLVFAESAHMQDIDTKRLTRTAMRKAWTDPSTLERVAELVDRGSQAQ